MAGVRCLGTSWVLQADWAPQHSVLSLVCNSPLHNDLFPEFNPADCTRASGKQCRCVDDPQKAPGHRHGYTRKNTVPVYQATCALPQPTQLLRGMGAMLYTGCCACARQRRSKASSSISLSSGSDCTNWLRRICVAA